MHVNFKTSSERVTNIFFTNSGMNECR